MLYSLLLFLHKQKTSNKSRAFHPWQSNKEIINRILFSVKINTRISNNYIIITKHKKTAKILSSILAVKKNIFNIIKLEYF